MERFPYACLLLLTVVSYAQTPAPATGGAPNPWPRPSRDAVMSIEEYDPKSSLKVPEHPKTRAKFPFIDVHNHQRGNMAPAQVDKLVADMDSINLQIMVNLSGGYGERLKQNIAALKSRYKNRFAVFANLSFEELEAADYSDRAARQLEEDFKSGAQGLKFFKNFGMDLREKSGARIKIDDPRFDKAFDICAKFGMPVLIHTAEPKPFFEPWDKQNERWLELKQFPSRYRPGDRYESWETLMGELYTRIKRHPKVTFINAHLGWLGADLGQLGKLMDEMPNMMTEIGAVLYEFGRQPRFARKWFIQYQDRVLFGKDTWEPGEYHYYFRVLETDDEYFDYYRKRHAFWKMYGLDLPDDVLKKLYYKNALRVIPGLDGSAFPN
jgi:predicted TIM-barrel fold metal-dependent hydrolase